MHRLYGRSDPKPDQKVVEKYLRLVPKTFGQVAVSIETLLDISTLTVDDITNRLKAVENRDSNTPDVDAPGKLLLTEEQWLTRSKQFRESSSKAKPKNHRRGQRGKRSGGKDVGEKDVHHPDPAWDKCHNCGRKGHWAKQCRSPKREQANLTVDSNNDEPALHLAKIVDLNLVVVGDVRFGDASIVEIHGQGTVIFAGRNGEHKAFTGMYYIPRLKNSIISIGQLDQGGSKVEIDDGVMRIWDRHWRLLVKVECGRTRLYILRLAIAKPVCLAARARSEGAWLWHNRYGHLNFDALRRLARDDMVQAEFARHCAEQGVERYFTVPYTPQQNGVMERRNQTVLATARALLKQRKVPALYWGEAVSMAIFLLNHAPTKALDGLTPYEAWTGKKPSVSFLRTFGCVAYTKIVKPGVSKLDDRSRPLVFISYASGTKAYRLLDPATGKVIVSHDVIFDESVGWDWEGKTDAIAAPATHDFRIEHIVQRAHEDAAAPMNRGARTPSPPPAAQMPSPAPATPALPAPHAAVDAPVPPIFVTPPSNDEDRLDAYHDDTPVRYRTVDDLLGDTEPPPGLAARVVDAELHLACTGEPATFQEASKEEAGQTAMREELKAVEENDTWELIDLSRGHRPIGLKWVYKLKRNKAGTIVKHKARLVAKGYVQQPGIDYEDAFAPVARLESVRLLLALAGHQGWVVHHMDVKSTFLNGVLREEVYVSQPQGFAVAGEENKVLRLHKALYGLRQAPRAWNARLDSTLKMLGFTQSAHEAGIYGRGSGGAWTLVGVYVDDLVITGAAEKDVLHFKEEMKLEFKMSDLGLLSFYLGIEVQQTAGGITASQGSYARKVLEVAGMSNCNPVHTPMEERLKLSHNSEAAEVDATLYRRIIGCLRYLVHTWPDISFAVGYVSRFLQRPTEEHMVAVKHILRYIAGTLDYGCFYARGGAARVKLIGYTDSDLTGDVDTSRSTSGGIFFFGSGPVSWHSLKQQVVALSSCEAEYVAATSAATQAIWLARLLSDFTGDQAETVGLNIDNMSTLALIKNPVFHHRSKHIRIKYYFVREAFEDGSISANFVRTQDQLADIFTKALGRVRFHELRARIGMVQSNQMRKD
ncbi:hypothetical protein QOZ80_8BG0656020 [Eleusine coracana subsp. coracana]|nr:hypothetical protein QOZ80_8BG0656020 [Eleusine coracana subsp. coracana]